MQVGDTVYIKDELFQGHVEGYEILRAFIDGDDPRNFLDDGDGTSYDWWLSLPTYDKTHNLELPYRTSELTLNPEEYL